jgi:hypothetical protein
MSRQGAQRVKWNLERSRSLAMPKSEANVRQTYANEMLWRVNNAVNALTRIQVPLLIKN